MNWQNLIDEVSAMSGSDEFKVFMLGMLGACLIQLSRMGIRWLRDVSRD